MSFLKKLIGFSIGPVVGAFISFLTIPLVTYFVSPYEYGKSSMFITVQILLLSFVYLGYDQAYAREYHEYENKKKLFQNSIIAPLILIIILFPLFYFYKIELSLLIFGDIKYGFLIMYSYLLLIFTIIERFILLNIRMNEDAYRYSLYSVVIKLSIFILTLIYLALGYRNFLVVIYPTIFGQLIFDIFLLTRNLSLFDFRGFKFDYNLFIKMTKFGLPLMIAVFFTSFLQSSGRFFLGIYKDFTDLGIFTAAIKVASLLAIVQTSFTSFWLPTAYRWNKEGKNNVKFNLISQYLILFLSIFFMTLVIFKNVIILLVSPEYIEAKFILPMLCLSPILFTQSETTTLGIVFSRKSYFNIVISLFSFIITVVLSISLIPRYGIFGAAIAQGTSFLFFYIARSYFSRKSGFYIDLKRQFIIVFLLYLVSLINLFDINKITIINIVFLLIIILIQQKNIKSVIFNKGDFKSV